MPSGSFDRPLLHFEGFVRPAGTLAPARNPRVSVLWTDPFQRKADLPMPARYLQSQVDVTAQRYSVDLFRPPPPETLAEVTAPSGETASLALGEIVMFDDRNGDGVFTVSGSRAEIAEPDIFLAATSAMVRYAARPFAQPQDDFPFGFAATAGYEMFDINCEDRESPRAPAARFNEPSDRSAIGLIAQTSRVVPEVRYCMRLHTP